MPALILDCDGVLADTEMYGHLPAFNRTFAEFDVPLQWSVERYGEKVLIGGGKERMRSEFTPEFAAEHPGMPNGDSDIDALVLQMHKRKTAIYTDLIDSGEIAPRPGIAELVQAADAAGWQLAVASTSAEPAVRAVLQHAVGDELAARFDVFAGDIVPRKKPAPDIYLHALAGLGVDPDDAVVVEDSANGLQAAEAAGIRTIVTVSAYTRDEPFDGAAIVLSHLGDDAEVLADPFGLAPRPPFGLDLLEQVRTRTPLPIPHLPDDTTRSTQ